VEPILHPESPLTPEELRSLGFPSGVRVVKESHLPDEHRFQVWAEDHAVRLVLHWYDLPGGEPAVRYEARREELGRNGRVLIEDRYGTRSYFAVLERRNEEYDVLVRHVEVGWVRDLHFGYVMAGNLEQEIEGRDLEIIVRTCAERLVARGR